MILMTPSMSLWHCHTVTSIVCCELGYVVLLFAPIAERTEVLIHGKLKHAIGSPSLHFITSNDNERDFSFTTSEVVKEIKYERSCERKGR